MTWIFSTLSSCSTAIAGLKANAVVRHIHSTNSSSTTVSRVHGIFLLSLENSSAISVVIATIIAKGMVVEKPHAMRCGFM